VLQQEDLQRVEPLLEHGETRGKLERNGGERNEAEQRRERETPRGARESDLPCPDDDLTDERPETGEGGRQPHDGVLIGKSGPDYRMEVERASRSTQGRCKLAKGRGDPM